MALLPWARELIGHHYGEIAHQFLLYGAVNDLTPVEREGVLGYTSLRDYLVELLRRYSVYVQTPGRNFDIVLFYSLSGGFAVREPESAQRLQELGFPEVTQATIGDRFAMAPVSPPVRDAFRQLEGLLRQKRFRVALILDHLERLARKGDLSPDQQVSIESLRRWAWDGDIRRETDHVIIGLTADRELVAEELYALDSQCRAIEIPRPGAEERRRFLQYYADSLARSAVGRIEVRFEGEDPLETLAGMTKGFLLINLQQLFMRAVRRPREERAITAEMVKTLKSEVIRDETGDLLEEKEPRLGFDALGGLEHILTYFREVSRHVDADARALIPKAVLLAGPPGTGKTLVAEALAKETGRNVVRLGNIRGMYVGESERNLTRALRLITELAPVIVFVDEIDQAIGSRGTGRSGDSGVSERLFGRILEVMGSNKYRGQIIWVAATNRTDVLDEAMLRRFDRILPVLIPGSPRQRLQITLSMEKQVENLSYDQVTRTALQSAAAGEAIEDDALREFGERTAGFTGSDLEVIVRRAREVAAEAPVTGRHLNAARALYKCNHYEDMYDLQTLLAIYACNFTDMIPAVEAFPEHLRGLIQKVLETRNNAPLEARIQELRNKVGMKRWA